MGNMFVSRRNANIFCKHLLRYMHCFAFWVEWSLFLRKKVVFCFGGGSITNSFSYPIP